MKTINVKYKFDMHIYREIVASSSRLVDLCYIGASFFCLDVVGALPTFLLHSL